MASAQTKVKRLPCSLLLVYGRDRHGCPHVEVCREDKTHSTPNIPVAIGPSLTVTWGGWSATGIDYDSPMRWGFGVGRLWVEVV